LLFSRFLTFSETNKTNTKQYAMAVSAGSYTPSADPNTPQSLVYVINSCFSRDPAERPSAAQILPYF